jgi:hypothetical protein
VDFREGGDIHKSWDMSPLVIPQGIFDARRLLPRYDVSALVERPGSTKELAHGGPAAFGQQDQYFGCLFRFGCLCSAQGTAVVDRVETMPARCRRRHRQQHLTLLSLGPALAAESNIGLIALTVSSQVSRD